MRGLTMLRTAGLLLLLACSGTTEDTGKSSGEGAGTSGNDGSDGTDLGCFADPASVEVGTGDSDFEVIESGAAITMVHGPQGGWHMLGSVRTHNMSEIVRVHFTVTHDESGVVVADNTYNVATIYDEAACVGVYPGMYGYLDVRELATGERDSPAELMAYDTVSFCMTVTDEDARVAEACLDVTATPDPSDLDDVPE